MDIINQTNNVDKNQKSKTFLNKRIKLIIYICIACLVTVMLIVGPILMQEFNGKVGSHHNYQAVCWVGAIFISIPILLLSGVCLFLIFKRNKTKQ